MLVLAGGGAIAQPLQWVGQLAAASELTDRGLLIGPRRPQLQAAVTAVHDQRWTLSLSAGAPVGNLSQGRLLAQIGRYERLSDDWQLDAGLACYAYPGDAEAGNGDRWELQLGAGFRDVLSLGHADLPAVPQWRYRYGGLSNLVNVAARQNPGLVRVAPGDAANSYLVRKLEGSNIAGSRMPLGGPFLDADTLARIKSWVASGAPNN